MGFFFLKFQITEHPLSSYLNKSHLTILKNTPIKTTHLSRGVHSVKRLFLISFLIFISAQIASASDAIVFGYTPTLDGVKYESLTSGANKVLLSRGDIPLINRPGTVEPIFSTRPLPPNSILYFYEWCSI